MSTPHPPEPFPYHIRAAESRDAVAIVALVRELAEFENLTHQLELTVERLQLHLFGPRPAAEAIVAETGNAVVAYALFFTNFSTFLAKPGLYLEDLYVQPAHRQVGLGKALLRHLGALAVARDYGRFEWTVLDWNVNAIRFYERMGATVLPEWRICRLAGDALAAYRRDEASPSATG
ncbi:MAG: GNAT family N-acetyltransferase [Opitutaceae bacterium]